MIQEAAMPSRGYLICSIERTGSNVLAEALTQTGLAGRPREYFSPISQGRPWMRDILGDSTMMTGLTKILLAGATPNGIFGAELYWAHLRYLAMALSEKDGESPQWVPGALLKSLEQLPKLMPTAEILELMRARAPNRAKFMAVFGWFQSRLPDLRVIWLRRSNMVARAIAHYRTLHSGPASTQNQPSAQGAPDFDLAQIHQLYCLGLFLEESWESFFRQQNITPHCVIYEDLVADYERTVRGALEFLDIAYAEKNVVAPNLVPEADALSEEWELRYHKLSEEAGL
jgi:LPS sulfotransferase NodH